VTIVTCTQATVLPDECPECGGWLHRVHRGGVPGPVGQYCEEDCASAAQTRIDQQARAAHLYCRDLLCSCPVCQAAGHPTEAEREEYRTHIKGDLEVIRRIILGYRYQHADESGLQAGVAAVLTAAGRPAHREVRLTARDRIDILTGRVGIEVKVRGATDALLRQLQRYAQHTQIDALIVVTTVAKHRSLPQSVGGKPLAVIHLGGTL
jgi:uncharacterized Zn finger protein (UPF0148 family)